MGPEILGVSDRLLAAVMNGIYQGILVTVLVRLSFRVFSRANAATRHAVWLCTLVLLVLLVVAHCFFHSRPPALQPGKIARTAATPEQEIATPDVTKVATTANGVPTETGSAGSKWPGHLPAEQEQLASQTPDSLPLTSTEPPYEVQKFSVGSVPPPGVTLRGGEPNSPSIAIDPLAASTADDLVLHRDATSGESSFVDTRPRISRGKDRRCGSPERLPDAECRKAFRAAIASPSNPEAQAAIVSSQRRAQ